MFDNIFTIKIKYRECVGMPWKHKLELWIEGGVQVGVRE